MVQSGCVKQHSEEGGVEGEDMAAAPFLFQLGNKFVVWRRKAIVSLPGKRPFYPNYLLPSRGVPRTIYEVGGQFLGSR